MLLRITVHERKEPGAPRVADPRRPSFHSGGQMGKFKHAVNLGVFLFTVWLLLSGHYSALLVGLGLLSTLFVVALAARVDLVDQETYPILIKPTSLSYWLWLGREIVKSNIDVSRRILNPRLPISPNLTRVKAHQRSELGLVAYANSITLVPGTVSLQVVDREILVHSLSQEITDELQRGEMDRRVCELERRL
jgi:multicomponent Na+:H+ antiporter subunit E